MFTKITGDKPLVMGILNMTPDSFSDGGRNQSIDVAYANACKMVEQGANIIDIGGESTRPGAEPVSLEVERLRVIPVVRHLASSELAQKVILSVDTQKPEIMREAIGCGAQMINDVNGFLANGAIEAVRDSSALLCVMHKQGDALTMQIAPRYHDVVVEVVDFLRERLDFLLACGIERSRIILDPGFGFGKTCEHNYQLLQHLEKLVDLGQPILVGLSRKSMLGQVTQLPIEQRDTVTAVANVLAATKGARIFRVHDVHSTCMALRIWQAMNGQLLI